MAFDSDDFAKLIYNNQTSTDFGIMVNVPWDPVLPTADGTDTHVTGRNGNLWQNNNGAYNNVTETFNCTVQRDPEQYPTWWDLHDAINAWLQIDTHGYSYLEFDLYPEWAFYAQALPFTFQTTSDFQASLTLQFNCSPLMTAIRGLDWKPEPKSGVILNTTAFPTQPEWHIKGKGDYHLIVNNNDYFFDDVEDELYLTSEGNAYYYDKDGAMVLANDKIRLANNSSPVFLCGKNTVKFEPQESDPQPDDTDTSQSTQPQTQPGTIEYKSLWKKVIV